MRAALLFLPRLLLDLAAPAALLVFFAVFSLEDIEA